MSETPETLAKRIRAELQRNRFILIDSEPPAEQRREALLVQALHMLEPSAQPKLKCSCGQQGGSDRTACHGKGRICACPCHVQPPAQPETPAPTCQWAIDDNDDSTVHETGCGQSFVFNDGGCDENRFRFCPYCGKTITETRTSADD